MARCQHEVTFGRLDVDVYTDEDSCWFEGPVYCKSIWTCPVCAAKIAEARTLELQQAIDAALSRGYGAAMVTQTFSHGKNDHLAVILPQFRAALRAFKSGRAIQELKQMFRVEGEVRAMEVTHGHDNGWHPHSHTVTFFKKPLNALEYRLYKAKLFFLWRAACLKHGLGEPSKRRGVDVRPAISGAQYVAKWGFASELCRLHTKRGKHGRTPWQLLADVEAGDHDARMLFREFADCFKGARQIFWSKGLKEKFDLGEVLTDEQALELPLSNKKLVASMNRVTWGCVVEARAFEMVADAAMRGKSSLEAILGALRERYGGEVEKRQLFEAKCGQFKWYMGRPYVAVA